MCLITKQKEPIILTEPLIVYKVMNDYSGQIKPAYHCVGGFQYKINKLNTTKIAPSELNMYFDHNVGYEYDLNDIDSLPDQLEKLKIFAYGAGFHFATNTDRLNNCNYSECMYECIIPAGSEVYYDKTGLGITNQIIVTKKIN
jgi:hypothetical protein